MPDFGMSTSKATERHSSWLQQDSYPPSSSARFDIRMNPTVPTVASVIGQLEQFIAAYPLLTELSVNVYWSSYSPESYKLCEPLLTSLALLRFGDTKVVPRVRLFIPLMSFYESAVTQLDRHNDVSDFLTVVATISAADFRVYGRGKLTLQFRKVTEQLGKRTIEHAVLIQLDDTPSLCAEMVFLFRALSALAEERYETQVWFEATFQSFNDEEERLAFYQTLFENLIFLADHAASSAFAPCGYLGVVHALLLHRQCEAALPIPQTTPAPWCSATHAFNFTLGARGVFRTCPFSASGRQQCPFTLQHAEVSRFAEAFRAFTADTTFFERLSARVSAVNILSRMEDYAKD